MAAHDDIAQLLGATVTIDDERTIRHYGRISLAAIADELVDEASLGDLPRRRQSSYNFV